MDRQVDAMKILRSMNRGGSSTESIGFYTLLKPGKWFAASRLAGSFHYPGSRSRSALLAPVPEQNVPSQADSRETAIPVKTVQPGAQNHPLVSSLLTVLGAIAITLLLLWWITSNAPANYY